MKRVLRSTQALSCLICKNKKQQILHRTAQTPHIRLLYLGLGGISVCDGCMIHLLMEFNVIVRDLPIPMFPERNVPCNTHNIRCLKVVRDVGGRPTWGTFRCQQVLNTFLTKSNMILPCNPELVLHSSLCNANRQINITTYIKIVKCRIFQ